MGCPVQSSPWITAQRRDALQNRAKLGPVAPVRAGATFINGNLVERPAGKPGPRLHKRS